MIVYYYYTRIFLMHFVCEEDCGGEGWKLGWPGHTD